MKEKETIKVYIDTKDGKTVCICERSNKRCKKNCTPDIVERDRFIGWYDCFHRDRYGE